MKITSSRLRVEGVSKQKSEQKSLILKVKSDLV